MDLRYCTMKGWNLLWKGSCMEVCMNLGPKKVTASGQNLVLPHFLISVSIPPPGSTSPETSCKSFKQFLRFFIANLMFNFQHEQSYLKKSDV